MPTQSCICVKLTPSCLAVKNTEGRVGDQHPSVRFSVYELQSISKITDDEEKGDCAEAVSDEKDTVDDEEGEGGKPGPHDG